MLQNPADFSDTQLTLPFLKQQLHCFAKQQENTFISNQDRVSSLVAERAEYIDALLIRLWRFIGITADDNIALIAVGGYGRKELHPLSDIDLLILSPIALDSSKQQHISEFIALLWDLKLTIGHSVRTLTQCLDIGMTDLSVATSLQEARFLSGDKSLYQQLKNAIFSPTFWPSADFFHAKVAEQQARHAHYHNTAYNLEPDIKSSPGGLRDIHTLSWIARRHFGATSLREMSKYGFLTDAEFRELNECQNWLWQVRFALHLGLKRADNRLTFASQPAVAELLGFYAHDNHAVESMMKQFYRTLGRVIELNKMLIRFFAAEIEKTPADNSVHILSGDFLRRGAQIEARKPALFQARPDSILSLFLHIAEDDKITAIAAPTLRQLRTARRRLLRPLNQSEAAREKFVSLIKHPNAISAALPLMHKHGVLAAYFPEWSRIVGQMQFDLFHAYTVDEHTIRLLKQFTRFADNNNRDEHPICCGIFPRLAKPELLILAAIFHDIGKGRGGDHSEIGALESYDFCIEHGFTRPEAKLVSWLVANHLIMSVTAQRRDIHDPDVIKEFAERVRDEEHLDHLICLTVADICATNPTLWNGWKRTLLTELYYATQKALRLGLENPPDVRERIRLNQQQAQDLLAQQKIDIAEIKALWQRFKADYFLRYTPEQIAWHTKGILQHSTGHALVLMSHEHGRGGNELFVFSEDKPSLFARVVAALERKNLSVHDAQIMTTKDGFALDSFMLLDANHQLISADRQQNIIDTVIRAIEQKSPQPVPNRRAPTKLIPFQFPPKVHFLPTRAKNKTLLELIALDTPGLLAKVGAVFARLEISLHAAKITTIGERAEDFFILTDNEKAALDEATKQQLKTALLDALSD